ncbi:hypothetical protein P7K49_032087, partial [Saguinus oedipus]
SFTAISLYAGIVLEMPVLKSLHRNRVQTCPSTLAFNSNSAGNACFDISPRKAFPDFPFNTGVYL